MAIKDEWQTPLDLYQYLNDTYGPFFLDACCTRDNCLVPSMYGRYFSMLGKESEWDYLKNPTTKSRIKMPCNPELGEAIFLNPPYSNPAPFLKKAWDDSQYFKVVCLVPTSILSAKYLDFLDKGTSEYTRDWVDGLQVIPLRRRTKFTHQSLKSSSPPGGCMLLIMDRRKDNED